MPAPKLAPIGPRTTTKLATCAFETAVARFGYPRQILTDHGSPYKANQAGGVSDFDRHLAGQAAKGPAYDDPLCHFMHAWKHAMHAMRHAGR